MTRNDVQIKSFHVNNKDHRKNVKTPPSRTVDYILAHVYILCHSINQSKFSLVTRPATKARMNLGFLVDPALMISSFLHWMCIVCATYWHMCKWCITYLLTFFLYFFISYHFIPQHDIHWNLFINYNMHLYSSNSFTGLAQVQAWHPIIHTCNSKTSVIIRFQCNM